MKSNPWFRHLHSTALALFVMVPVATGLVAVPTTPDFSGVWTVQSAGGGGRGQAAGSLGSGWGPSFTIRQFEDDLTVERTFFSRGDIQPALKFRYSLKGIETHNRVWMGHEMQEQVSTTVWDGDQLVITTTYSFKNPADGQILTGELRQKLRLQPARLLAWPPSLLIETTRSGALGGPSSTTRTVYTKPG